MKSCYARFSAKRFEMLVRKGWTDQECADFFDISLRTLSGWKEKHPKFLQALKEWKESADFLVEKSLYERAMGIKYDEITYEKSKIGGLGIKLEDGEIEQIKHEEMSKTKIVTKWVPPDTTAQIFWLKNRQPDKWRDKKEEDGSGGTTNIYIVKNGKKELVNKPDVITRQGRTLHINA